MNQPARGPAWVFFDLDGTLADTITTLYGVYLDFLNDFGVRGSREEFDELNGPSLPEVVAILRERYALPEPGGGLLASYTARLRDIYGARAVAFPEAEAVLRTVKKQGRRLLLASSAPGQEARAFVQRHGWDGMIEAYVSGDDVTCSKPDPALYRLALERAGAEPDEAVAVEDIPKGIASAVAAGLAAIGVTHTHEAALLRAAGAAHIIQSLNELPRLLEEL